MRYFFIGIGGIGMSALAELLNAQGHQVRGSDVASSKTVDRLIQRGIPVQIGHGIGREIEHEIGREIEREIEKGLHPAEIIVVNSAISPHNPIWLAAQKLGCKILRRGELLAEFVNAHQGLVVAGSHGKTTTSSMLAHILETTGRSPSFAIGGRLQDSGRNATLGVTHGESGFFVAEGDESDASFLALRPKILAVTNIDADHMSTYGHSFDALIHSFVEWILNLSENGVAVLNQDDPGVLAVLEAIQKLKPEFWETRSLVLVGKKSISSKIIARNRLIILDEISQQLADIKVNFIDSPGGSAYFATWPLIGEFNAMNALMAGAMANAVGVSWPEIIKALCIYPGVERRMQYLGNILGAEFFEDYGHHPAEIRASLLGLREAYPNARLVQVFQPHRYTRTRDLWDEFIEAFSLADCLILLPIYPASEAPIVGITSEALLANILAKIPSHSSRVLEFLEFSPDLVTAFSMLLAKIQPGDLVVLQGAGDIPAKLGEKIFASG